MKDNHIRDLVPIDARAAIWTYFLDHSQIQKNGYWGVMFYTRDQDDFWRRVQWRFLGNSSYDIEEKKARQRAKFDEMVFHRVERKKWDEKIKNIKENGSIWEKMMVWIYFLTKNHIKKVKIAKT